jgi:hypothetical protein
MSAKEAGKKTSKEADDAIENAVIELGNYERRYHFNETVAERIKMAEKADKSSLKALNCLVENIRVREELIALLHHTLMLIFSH